MIAVIFEATPRDGMRDAYLDAAAQLRPLLDGIDGFISIERFESLTRAGTVLSLSFWRDEAAVIAWRSHAEHAAAQRAGRGDIFDDYRIRVAATVRDYSMTRREEAPQRLPPAAAGPGLTPM